MLRIIRYRHLLGHLLKHPNWSLTSSKAPCVYFNVTLLTLVLFLQYIFTMTMTAMIDISTSTPPTLPPIIPE